MYQKEKRRSQNSLQDLENGPNSVEMTQNRGDKSKQDEYEENLVKSPRPGVGSAQISQGMPILAHNRGTSYGSCDNSDTREVSAKKQDGRHHPSKHRINSDILDFGEHALLWLGSFSQRLLKKKPSKISSWLGFSELSDRPAAAFERKDSVSRPDTVSRSFPCISSMPRHDVERIRTTRLGGVEDKSISNRRTVFSLFGLDVSQAECRGMELEDLTHESARPPASMVSSPTEGMNQLKQATIDEAHDKPRCLSITKYLEEISKIGANGAFGSTELSEPIEAGSSLAMTNARVTKPGPRKDICASDSQQSDGTALHEVIVATPSTINSSIVTGQSKVCVTSQQEEATTSDLETMPRVVASSTSDKRNTNDWAESEGSTISRAEKADRAEHEATARGKQAHGWNQCQRSQQRSHQRSCKGAYLARCPRRLIH